MTNIIDLLGRIFISVLFFLNGIFKIKNYDGTIEWMETYDLPGIMIIPAIVIEIVAPILVVIGYKTKIAAALLFLFCISTAFIFHNDFSDQMQLTAFLKNIALAGGFMFLIANGARDYSLDKK